MKVFPSELAERTSNGFKRTSTADFRTSLTKERTSILFCRSSFFQKKKKHVPLDAIAGPNRIRVQLPSSVTK
ncbi:hypothetical protein [Planococcus wigleyi]|uniref:Uncharacterized protein n=1 Tax=Planococcus wigleyi TaxID=2762216 RepID=A0ABR8W8X7_9BACL|nr:hypothetical protein [Planococcus wigleyi]MBD8013454.1 hypothetical protein [Planococcus wigleyi]